MAGVSSSGRDDVGWIAMPGAGNIRLVDFGETFRMHARPAVNVPASVTCPDCGTHMAAVAVVPLRFSESDEDVTYRCRKCRGELKITLKSGC